MPFIAGDSVGGAKGTPVDEAFPGCTGRDPRLMQEHTAQLSEPK